MIKISDKKIINLYTKFIKISYISIYYNFHICGTFCLQ